jgi:tetratricopeptide (TPR) repeat protein
VEQQVHRARQTEFDQKADDDILQRSKPRTLTGLDLAEAKLAEGDINAANAMARKVLADKSDTLDSVAEEARADFILARVAIATGHPEEAINDFQKTISTSKEPRLIAWSHIYLARMLDLECKRPEAITEYQQALSARDGQQDTRLAAERGVKTAYAMKGRSCEEDADAPDGAAPPKSDAPNTQQAQPKPQ